MKRFLLSILLVISTISIYTQPIYNSEGIELKHIMTAEEAALYDRIEMSTTPTDPPVGTIRPIGEFEPCEGVLVRYPFGIPLELIKELASYTKVITIVKNTYEQNTVTTQYQNNNINLDNCEFLIANTDSYWTRDYGPWFMAIDDEKVAMYDFTYNRPRPNDNMVNTKLANHLSIERYASNLQGCGGNYMSDSKEQAASTDLILDENSNYTEEQIRQHFKDYLGVENYIITDDPLADYIRHIDCWGKFLAPNKVMIGQVPQSDPRYANFEEVAELFANTPSAWGMPYEVYRVYTPGTGYKATPYTNSLILNNKVFIALSGSQHDAAAIASYQEAMPGYEIIGINYGGWENTDALHCRTHEINDREMLYIRHQPLYGEVQSNDGTIQLTTEIYSYGGHDIYQDSVLVYVRTEGSDYQPYNFTNTNGNTWSVTLSGFNTGEIEYYIYAADNSGRNECHPYIGAPDPHKFNYVTDVQGPNIVFDKDINYTSNNETNHTIIKEITNSGVDNLTFTIDNITSDGWLSISPISGQVEPNGKVEISINCNNLEQLINGEYNGSFVINSNALNNPAMDVNVLLNVNNFPITTINSTNLNFNTNTSGVVTENITVTNSGLADLNMVVSNVSVNSNIDWLSVDPTTFTVEPNTEQIINVLCNIPENTQSFVDEGSFVLTSNDVNSPEITVNVNLSHVLGIDDSDVNLLVYPNPFDAELIIQGDINAVQVKVSIFNLTGKTLIEDVVNIYDSKLDYHINTSSLSEGLYFYKIIYKDNIVTGKIVKK